MKIDNYITHLKLRKKALQRNLTELLLITDKVKKRKNTKDPNFDEITRIRDEIKEINNKLKFLLDLRKETKKNESRGI